MSAGRARPTVRVEFEDRYRLWQELVREADLRGGRIFVPTDRPFDRGEAVNLSVVLAGEDGVLIEVRGRVEHRRPGTARFARGIFVRLERDNVEALQRAIGVISAAAATRGRRVLRYPMAWPVRFKTPALPRPVFTEDLSCGGMQVSMPERVRRGHILEFVLETPQGHALTMSGTVMWTSEESQGVGIAFRFADDETADFFGDLVEAAGSFSRDEAAEKVHRSVLVADDDGSFVEMVRATLQGMADIVTAHSGEEALARVRAERPDVVLLDILMPRLDGPTVCRAIRADVELSKLPVVFISAVDDGTLEQHAVAAGASTWICKPFTPSQLRAVVEGLFDNKLPSHPGARVPELR